jgi:probable HAF family extracellular repeat protein
LIFLTAALVSSTAQGEPIHLGSHIQLTNLGEGVFPRAINNHGYVVGQTANGEAFLWDSGDLYTLGTLGGAESFANDVNDNGVVVGWSFDGNGVQKAVKWENGVMTNLDSVSTLASVANAVNVHDQIVGWKTNGSIFRSAQWLNGNIDQGGQLMFGLGNHKAIGINDQGKIVGVTLDQSNDLFQGYYWNGADPITGFSGGLGQQYFPLAGVSNNDLTAGDFGDLAASMAIGDNGPTSAGSISSDDLFSIALGLNDNGIIVGESDHKGFAFDRATGTMYNLNDFSISGFEVDTILRLTDINNDGSFVGVAQFDGIDYGIKGNFHVVPEPSTLVLAATGVGATWIATQRRRRRRAR